MQKEIFDSSKVIKEIAQEYLCKKSPLNQINKLKIRKSKNIFIIGCGSAYNSALVGKYYLEKVTKKNIEAVVASEFKACHQKLTKNSVCIFVSQSGETADTLACARIVKNIGCYNSYAITNSTCSSLCALVNYVLPLYAGVEVAVASTKAYVAQVIVLYLLAKKLSLNDKNYKYLFKREKNILFNFSKDVYSYFNCKKNLDLLNSCAERLLKYKNIFLIAKGIDFAFCKECGLKLKEISYLPCQEFSSGELKHGPLALVDDSTIVVCMFFNEKSSNAIEEISARGGKTLVLGKSLDIPINFYKKDFVAIKGTIIWQQIAFYASIKLGNNPDMPRNLAKSVTVE